MLANPDRSSKVELKAQREVLRRDLATVERELIRNQQTQARLEKRIRILERGPRLAA